MCYSVVSFPPSFLTSPSLSWYGAIHQTSFISIIESLHHPAYQSVNTKSSHSLHCRIYIYIYICYQSNSVFHEYHTSLVLSAEPSIWIWPPHVRFAWQWTRTKWVQPNESNDPIFSPKRGMYIYAIRFQQVTSEEHNTYLFGPSLKTK